MIKIANLEREGAFYQQILYSSGGLSPELSERVRAGLRIHVESLGKVSLEEAFGSVPRRSVRTLARRLAGAKRDAAYVAAYRAQAGCDSLAAWRRCTILGAELGEFARMYWPAWCKAGAPEAKTSGHEARLLLYQIFAALPDERPAMSANGVYQALKRAGELK